MTNTARALNLAGWAFGLASGTAGIFLMLAVFASPVAASDNPAGGCRLVDAAAFFDPCADLDASRVVVLPPVETSGDDLAAGA
jgi:hypothetical protein